MKKLLIIIALSLIFVPFAPAADPTLNDQKEKVSYSIGLDIGGTLKRQLIDVNEEILDRGIKDGLTGGKPLLTDAQVKEVMATFQKDMIAKQVAVKKAAGEKNDADGKKFLEANKTKDGVKTTSSGLQYTVENEGKGSLPKATDTVKVNYRGTTIDGKEFDSSYKRNEPATFPVNRVIKGWTEALQLMKVGSKYHLVIPSELAYGEHGAGQDIGPNSTLIFDVELLSIEPPAAAALTQPANADASRPAGQRGAAIPPKGARTPAAAPTASPSEP